MLKDKLKKMAFSFVFGFSFLISNAEYNPLLFKNEIKVELSTDNNRKGH